MADRVYLSAETLKGISHPVRVRLLALLREDGPSTATRLAERIGQSSGVTSYHLRQLAQYGFVSEDAERGSGRERWWRATHRYTTLEAPAARSAPEASEAYMRAIATANAERIERWLGEMPGLPAVWDDSATLSDTRLRLSPEESAQLVAELEAVIDRYRRDDPEAEAPAGTERVVVQWQVMPFVGGAS